MTASDNPMTTRCDNLKLLRIKENDDVTTKTLAPSSPIVLPNDFSLGSHGCHSGHNPYAIGVFGMTTSADYLAMGRQ